MRLVVDTNILFSAMIRDSFTRKILVSSSLDFFMPEFALTEIEKHKGLLVEKSGLSKEDIELILGQLTENIHVVPVDEFSKFVSQAKRALEDIDLDDIPFLALALSFINDGIWSDDKGLKKQDLVKVWTTTELYGMLDHHLDIE